MRTFAVAKRIISQIVADHRSVAFLLVAPIFVLFLLKTVLNSGSADVRLMDVNASISTTISITNVTIEKGDLATAEEKLKNDEIDAYINYTNGDYNIKLNGTDSMKSSKALAVAKQVIAATLNEKIPEKLKEGLQNVILKLPDNLKPALNNITTLLPKTPNFNVSTLYGLGENAKMFDSLAPLIMGFIVFFFTFIFSGIAFLRENLTGTMERMMATPVRRSEIVMGYFFGFGLFIALQTIIMLLFASTFLGIHFAGNYFLLLFIYILLAAQSLALGLALSAFARNEFQLFQFIPVIIIPQILFSGLFDISNAPAWVKFLSKFFPLTYGAEAVKMVAIQGKDFISVLPLIGISFGFFAVFLIFNAVVLKKYRAV